MWVNKNRLPLQQESSDMADRSLVPHNVTESDMTNSLSHHMTLVVTTSPTPSAPSTQLLSAVLSSFKNHCPALLSCHIIVVFDTYDHITERPRLKKGQVTPDQAEAFTAYKANVQGLVADIFNSGEPLKLSRSIDEAEFGSPGCAENSVTIDVLTTDTNHVTFIEPCRRLGFSLAVRSALRITRTQYVWVHQHDWILTSAIPIESFIAAMSASSEYAPISYICLPSIRLLSYAVQHDTLRFPALRELTQSLQGEYPLSSANGKIPLTPLFFWHDKPHIADRSHYLARVFPSRYAMRRGEFIEDTIGQKARQQMKDGQWHKWASWLYYPDQGKSLCLRHLQGRTWKGTENETHQKRFDSAPE